MTAESWVFGGNDPELGLGLNHLPYTAFVDEESGKRRLAVVIGACLLDLHRAAEVLPPHLQEVLSEPTLNAFMALGPASWQELRTALQLLLSRQNRDRRILEAALVPTRSVSLELPAKTENYTDFYASMHHARRVGELFRPNQPLLDNYAWLPIGYHGRASSLLPSGTPVRRPHGQMRSQTSGDPTPRFGPTEKLDYELELAFFIGQGNILGQPIALAEAEQQIFGVSLLNDWSARDVQAWEYQPLGPFLGKNFATTLSPLLTPIAALQPFRVPAVSHKAGLPPYLKTASNERLGGLYLKLRVTVSTGRSRAAGLAPFHLGDVDSKELYWTPAQMIAHHTSGGCNLQPGDVLASGTLSGPERESAGCLLELTRNGAEPIVLPNGESRGFLEDGDEVLLTGLAQAPGEMPVRLGECRALILACPTYPITGRS